MAMTKQMGTGCLCHGPLLDRERLGEQAVDLLDP